jgi:hypothetical protein
MFVEQDLLRGMYIKERVCLQCGNRRDEATLPPPSVIGRPINCESKFEVSDYVTKKKYLEKLGSRRRL